MVVVPINCNHQICESLCSLLFKCAGNICKISQDDWRHSSTYRTAAVISQDRYSHVSILPDCCCHVSISQDRRVKRLNLKLMAGFIVHFYNKHFIIAQLTERVQTIIPEMSKYIELSQCTMLKKNVGRGFTYQYTIIWWASWILLHATSDEYQYLYRYKMFYTNIYHNFLIPCFTPLLE